MAISHSKSADPAPTNDGYQILQGRRYYWQSYGETQAEHTVLLLHHGLGSVRSWKRQIPALEKQGWRIVAFDRWGYGRSDPRPAFETGFLHHESQAALDLMDALEINQASLVGHSDGGSIAILMAAHAPERVQRMALVAAHVYVEPKMADGLRSIEEAAQRPALQRALAREHGGQARQLLQAWLNGWRMHGRTTLDLERYLPLIECPTLVIQGLEDQHATQQHALDLAAKIQQSTLWLIPNVAHMPMSEVPQAFNQRLISFLGS